MAFFLISSILVLGFLDQLQVFSQLYLIELLGLLTGLGLLELWHLIYSRLLTGFGMLVFFTNLRLMEFQVKHLAFFVLCSVISQEHPVNNGVSQGSILCPTLFLLNINDLPDDVICNIGCYLC